MDIMTKIRHAPWFDTLYRAGVVVKGLDGLAELVVGLTLLFAPHLIRRFLEMIIGTTYHHGHTMQFVATYVARLDSDLAHNGATFLIVFLIGHGLVKLVLVYCLLLRMVRVYPYALCLLGAFLIYQLYVIVRDPSSVGMWLFSLLDIVIIWIVYGEWRDLREDAATRKNTQQSVH